MVDAGFLTAAFRDTLGVAADPTALLAGFAAWQAPEPKWRR
jgi:hypothetical protein